MGIPCDDRLIGALIHHRTLDRKRPVPDRPSYTRENITLVAHFRAIRRQVNVCREVGFAACFGSLTRLGVVIFVFRQKARSKFFSRAGQTGAGSGAASNQSGAVSWSGVFLRKWLAILLFTSVCPFRGAELISVAFSGQSILILTEAGLPTLAIAKGGGSSTKVRSKRPLGKVDSYYCSDP